MDDNKKAASLRVGQQTSWGPAGEVIYGRPLIHVGQHQRCRTKREEANFCAWCEGMIRTGQPKVNVLGYGAAHFHAACFVQWAIAAAAEAGDDVSPFASLAGAVPLLRTLRWIQRYAQSVEQTVGKFPSETPPEQKLVDVARAIGVWAGNALAQAEAGGGHEALEALLEAAQSALDWFQAAPIAELEAVEDALGENAPMGDLAIALMPRRFQPRLYDAGMKALLWLRSIPGPHLQAIESLLDEASPAEELAEALGTGLVGQVVERYADISRQGYTLEDAVADVLEEVHNGC